MKKLYGLIECCLNWRVVVGLVIVGGALFLYAPRLALASLPVLAALVCPISMIFMMRSMGRMNRGGGKPDEPPANPNLQDLSREQQLRLLQERLKRVQAQHGVVARQLALLEAGRAGSGIPVVAGGNGKVGRN